MKSLKSLYQDQVFINCYQSKSQCDEQFERCFARLKKFRKYQKNETLYIRASKLAIRLLYKSKNEQVLRLDRIKKEIVRKFVTELKN